MANDYIHLLVDLTDTQPAQQRFQGSPSLPRRLGRKLGLKLGIKQGDAEADPAVSQQGMTSYFSVCLVG